MAVVRRLKEAGFVIVGKTQHARVRDHGGHRVRPERRLPESLGPAADARRLVGRRGGRGRGGRAPARARLRRRRLDPHSRLLLRPLRAQAVARPRLARALRRAARSSCRQSGPISVSVRDTAAFLDVLAGYEPGDAHWAPPPERPFLDEVGADPDGCASRSRPSRRSAPGRPASSSRVAALRPTRSPSSATRWSRRRRRGVDDDAAVGSSRSPGSWRRRCIPCRTSRC